MKILTEQWLTVILYYFTKKLEEIGNIRVISGATFGENGDNFIRVNIATPLEILKEALLSIKKTIESF